MRIKYFRIRIYRYLKERSVLGKGEILIRKYFILIYSHDLSEAFAAWASSIRIIEIKQMRIRFFKYNSIQFKPIIIIESLLGFIILNIAGPSTFQKCDLNGIADPVYIIFILLFDNEPIDYHQNFIGIYIFQFLFQHFSGSFFQVNLNFPILFIDNNSIESALKKKLQMCTYIPIRIIPIEPSK